MKALTSLSMVLLSTAVLSAAQVIVAPVSINGRIPLGIETFRLEPAKQDFYLMASAENPDFIGIKRVMAKGEPMKLVARDGKKVSAYPERIQFRLTASSREKLLEDHPFGTEAKIPLNELLVKLKFRLKIFHGLEYRYVEPAFVDDVGVPRNLPYNERIYRIGFNMGHVPIEDRVVMEVISPTGERLCKFHLDLL
jgi:hypothetical protein